MNDALAALPAPDDESPPSLKRFLLQAILWLPLAFFLWYVLRTAVVMPSIRIAGWVLTHWMPELFTQVAQDFEKLTFDVAAQVGAVAGLPGESIEVSLAVNALMYCYGLAVLIGLVMATPLDWKRTFAQIAGGFVVLLPVQAFGLVGEVLKSVAFELDAAVRSGIADAGYADASAAAGTAALGAAQAMLAAHGVTQNVIGLCYQFGYLILPPITPVVFWILCNRRFIEQLGARLSPALATKRRGNGQ